MIMKQKQINQHLLGLHGLVTSNLTKKAFLFVFLFLSYSADIVWIHHAVQSGRRECKREKKKKKKTHTSPTLYFLPECMQLGKIINYKGLQERGGAVHSQQLDRGHLDYTLRGHLWVRGAALQRSRMHRGSPNVWECMLKGGRRRCYSQGWLCQFRSDSPQPHFKKGLISY